MSEEMEGYPVLPHLGSEFLLWLWYHSDTEGGCFNFTGIAEDEEDGQIDPNAILSVNLWVDERIALRQSNENKVTAVLTGDNPSAYLESKAALAGGKVLQELRVGLRTDDREYFVTLKGPELRIHAAALPAAQIGDGEDAFAGLVAERMLLLEELDRILALLFREYCLLRTSLDWLPTAKAMYSWVHDSEA